jgi:hypothetical protein
MSQTGTVLHVYEGDARALGGELRHELGAEAAGAAGHERHAVAQARIGREPGHGTTTARPTAPCVSAAYASLTCSSA